MSVDCKTFDFWHSLCIQREIVTNIVFGNGFSIGLESSFSYGCLYDKAKEFGLPDLVIKQFEKYGTTNFERVLKELIEAVWIAELYGLDNNAMAKDSEKLRSSLLRAISKIHPSRRKNISINRWQSCNSFLRRFNCIFTVNYDLLLYWATLQDLDGRFNDGFSFGLRDLEFNEEDATELGSMYFLHGALHLMIRTDGVVIKRRAADSPLIQQITESMNNGIFPLIVTEGTWESKKGKIDSNVYLSASWRVFKKVSGALFIFGHSLSEQDQHLLDAIVLNPNLSMLLVGLYGEPDSQSNGRVIHQAVEIRRQREKLSKEKKLILPPLRVEFFDSATAPIWSD